MSDLDFELLEDFTQPTVVANLPNGVITIVNYGDASINAGTITINGIDFVEGADWTASVSNNATASSLNDVIIGNSGNKAVPGIYTTLSNNVISIYGSIVMSKTGIEDTAVTITTR